MSEGKKIKVSIERSFYGCTRACEFRKKKDMLRDGGENHVSSINLCSSALDQGTVQTTNLTFGRDLGKGSGDSRHMGRILIE